MKNFTSTELHFLRVNLHCLHYHICSAADKSKRVWKRYLDVDNSKIVGKARRDYQDNSVCLVCLIMLVVMETLVNCGNFYLPHIC